MWGNIFTGHNQRLLVTKWREKTFIGQFVPSNSTRLVWDLNHWISRCESEWRSKIFRLIYQQLFTDSDDTKLYYITPSTDLPREKGHIFQIFKIDLFRWFDSRVLPVWLTEFLKNLDYFLFYTIFNILNLLM